MNDLLEKWCQIINIEVLFHAKHHHGCILFTECVFVRAQVCVKYLTAALGIEPYTSELRPL